MSEELVRQLAEHVGGSIEEIGILPDGSGFAVMSMPLSKGHWIYQVDESNEPPMPMRMGTNDPNRQGIANMLRAAGRYAIKVSTSNGKDMDFDPDALLQNLVVGMLGYWTPSGLSEME